LDLRAAATSQKVTHSCYYKFMQEIIELLTSAIKDLFSVDLKPELTRPDEQFGDYATNIAMQLGKKLHKNPREIAVALAGKLHGAEGIADVSIAGPGFINLRLTNKTLWATAQNVPAKSLDGKTIVVEYSDPNPFKILHVGHVYTTVVGEAVANLLENAGAKVHRVNFGGDVGLHVGKTMWAILKALGGPNPEKLSEIKEEERTAWLAERYIEGTRAYDENEQAKEEIIDLNKRAYRIHAEDDHDSPLAQIYWTCRDWSYQAFDAFYAQLGAKLEKYYPESEVADLGLTTVKENIGKVFEESDGAVVFRGEKYGLHTRVFINSQGLPTYEAKDVGLILKKYQDYKFDKSVVVTGNEQQQYMGVVLKAIEQFSPELASTTTYIPHGMVRLDGNVKMSSRLGNIIRATDVLSITHEAIKESGRDPNDITMLGAIKYAFLKNRMGGDIIYDPKESVSLEGNSGPYLQYAHARARSILSKAGDKRVVVEQHSLPDLEAGERSLVRKIGEYSEVVDKATAELIPHHIATYIYELSQVFNRFYENSHVIGDPRESIRLKLVSAYADTLKSSLAILGIFAPDKM
jgi:arginyl-tRNA synthetase